MGLLARFRLGLSVLLKLVVAVDSGIDSIDPTHSRKPVKHALGQRYSFLTLQLSIILFSITLLAVVVSHFMAFRTQPAEVIPTHMTTELSGVKRMKELVRQSSDAILGGIAGMTKRLSKLSKIEDSFQTGEENERSPDGGLL